MKFNKKAIGWLFFVLAIIFIEPSPDPLTFSIYAASHGLEFSTINAGNLASHFFDFQIWSIGIGLLFLVIAMYFLGWDLKKLMKKLNLEKYRIALLLGVLAVLAVTYFKIQGFLIYALFGAIALGYWFFVHKDKSETLAVFITPLILMLSGLSYLMSFVFEKSPIPETIPCLDNHFFIGWVSSTLGFESVTNTSLMISIFIGSLILILLTKFLKEKV